MAMTLNIWWQIRWWCWNSPPWQEKASTIQAPCSCASVWMRLTAEEDFYLHDDFYWRTSKKEACLDASGVTSDLYHPEDLEDGEDAHQPLNVSKTSLLFLLLHFPRSFKVHVFWQFWLVSCKVMTRLSLWYFQGLFMLWHTTPDKTKERNNQTNNALRLFRKPLLHRTSITPSMCIIVYHLLTWKGRDSMGGSQAHRWYSWLPWQSHIFEGSRQTWSSKVLCTDHLFNFHK